MIIAKDVRVALELMERVRPMFAGINPEIVGAVLADLLATLLAGHIVDGDPKATRQLRKELLQFHILQVRRLIPINEQQILEREAEEEAKNATIN
jgi:hypothetical protein